MTLKLDYSINIAKSNIKAASLLLENYKTEPVDQYADTNVIIYLSMISIEISLKYALNRAGFSLAELIGKGHDIKKLFKAIKYETIADNNRLPMSLGTINLKTEQSGSITVGKLISNLEQADNYPYFRYAGANKHYPPRFMLECAKEVAIWCEQNADKLTKSS